MRALLQDVLRDLRARASAARTRADRGGPAPLSRLISNTLRDHDARVLADPGARSDIEGEAPELAASFFEWLDAPLVAEAEWRSRWANTRLRFGEAEIDVSGLFRALTDPDPARSEAAWSEGERLWARAGAALGWVEDPVESDPKTLPTPVTTSAGLIIPDASMVAAVLTGAPSADRSGPERSALDDGFGEMVALAMELVDATGGRADDWASWSVSVDGLRRDFRGEDNVRSTGDGLPYPRAMVPVVRGDRRAELSGHSARELILRKVAGGLPLAGAVISPTYAEQVLGAPRGSSTEWVREIVLAWIGLAVESRLSSRFAADPEGLRSAARGIVSDGPPSWWCEVMARTPAVASMVGERQSLYVHDGALERALRDGLQAHLHFRERYDEDWFLDERIDASRWTAEADAPLSVWDTLREAARL